MPKISEYPSATSVVGTEVLPIVQSSSTKKVTIETLIRKPIFEIDLTSADYTIDQYGLYYITTGSTGLTPYTIILPDPALNDGMELMFFNYDQIDTAQFDSTYQPYLNASTDAGDKYTEIPSAKVVLIVSINGYWSACRF